MLGVSTPAMAAAVSNEGGLGSLAVGGLSPEVTRDLIRKTKTLTTKPFAVNLFVHDVPPYTDADLEPMRKLLLTLATRKGYDLTSSDLTNFRFYTYKDQIEILLQEKIQLISFTFGCLDSSTIKTLKNNDCILIGTATCLEEASILQRQGIDMIVAQGIEAGGHRGTFIDNVPLPQIDLVSLLSQFSKDIRIPFIAAGGINNKDAVKAALDLGAIAVQIGTAFIGTAESEAIPSYKQRLQRAKDGDSSLTRAFSGRWARGLRNQMMDDIEGSGIIIPPYPYQNSLTSKLRKLAQQNNDADYTNLWSGRSAGKEDLKTSREVFLELVK